MFLCRAGPVVLVSSAEDELVSTSICPLPGSAGVGSTVEASPLHVTVTSLASLWNSMHVS